jgi:hypothetical protein
VPHFAIHNDCRDRETLLFAANFPLPRTPTHHPTKEVHQDGGRVVLLQRCFYKAISISMEKKSVFQDYWKWLSKI